MLLDYGISLGKDGEKQGDISRMSHLSLPALFIFSLSNSTLQSMDLQAEKANGQ
jgi:hypothetical protein